MPTAGRRRLIWGGLLAIALLIRVIASCIWQAHLPNARAFDFPDSESYWVLGQRIARGDTYEFAGARAFRTPGYPAALAPLFWVFGDDPPVVAVRMVGALLGVVVVAAVGRLAWKLFDERTGWIAALLCALYPGAIAMSILVLSEALFCPLMVGQLLLWALASRVGRTAESVKRDGVAATPFDGRRWLLLYATAAGVLAALATLTRPSWLLFTPLAVVVSIAMFPHRKSHLVIGTTMLLAMALTMSPWWIRNAFVLNTFVPTTTQVGASLYDGLHPDATGASDMSFAPKFNEAFRRSKAWKEQQHRVAYEVALNRHFAKEASDWACDNPASVASLAVVKVTRMWNIWPNETRLRSWPMRLMVAIGYVPILAGAIFGAWRFTRRGWPYVLCFLPAIYFTLLHMVFVGSIRYRQPPMLLLIVLAAGWITSTFMDRVSIRKES